tara:strand:- start:401 stop:814 length:414 start_codon:yes stop_codon:yes gene_type:complete
MSLIEEALWKRLTDHSGTTALISNRLYPVLAPQKVTRPFVVYRRVSGLRVQSHQGASGLSFDRFQFSAWDDDYVQTTGARMVSEQIRLALEGYAGTILGVRIDGILMVTELDTHDEETELYGVISDFEVAHNEAEPS